MKSEKITNREGKQESKNSLAHELIAKTVEKTLGAKKRYLVLAALSAIALSNYQESDAAEDTQTERGADRVTEQVDETYDETTEIPGYVVDAEFASQPLDYASYFDNDGQALEVLQLERMAELAEVYELDFDPTNHNVEFVGNVPVEINGVSVEAGLSPAEIERVKHYRDIGDMMSGAETAEIEETPTNSQSIEDNADKDPGSLYEFEGTRLDDAL